MQQVFLEVWQRGPDYDPRRGSPLAWVMTIARSRAIDHLRRRIPEPRDPGRAPRGAPQRLRARRAARALAAGRAARRASPPRRPTCCAAASTRAAARRRSRRTPGVPLGTVKSRMVAGLARLREALDREEQARMSERDPLIARLESLGPDEWQPEPAPAARHAPRAPATPRRRRALTLRPLPAIAAALLLLALGAGGALIADLRRRGPGPHAGPRAAARRRGAAEGKLAIARTGGRATLAVSGLAPSRRGEFYELWLLSPPGDLVSLGSFRVAAGGRATVEVPVPVDPSRYRFVDVSVERGRRRSVALLALRPARPHLSWFGARRTLDRGRAWNASSWRRRQGPTSPGSPTPPPSSPIRPAPPSRSSRSTGSTSRPSPPPRAPSSATRRGDRQRLRRAPRARPAIQAEGDVRTGLVVPGVLLFAEEKDADVIVCGALDQGPSRPPRARQRAGRADRPRAPPRPRHHARRRRSDRWRPLGEEAAASSPRSRSTSSSPRRRRRTRSSSARSARST